MNHLLLTYVIAMKKLQKFNRKKDRHLRRMSLCDHCVLCKGKLSPETCVLPCSHVFCKNCISRSSTHSQLCPQCGEPFSRVHEEIDHKPTGYVFSAKALSNLYSITPPSFDDMIPESREESEPAIVRPATRIPVAKERTRAIQDSHQRTRTNRIAMQPVLHLV